MIVARRLLIGGRVQGVGFRMFAAARAAAEGIHGYVQNLPDGRVEALVEGDEEGGGSRRACAQARSFSCACGSVTSNPSSPSSRPVATGFQPADAPTPHNHETERNAADGPISNRRIRHVPDFPKPGILFYDVTTLLRDPDGFRLCDRQRRGHHSVIAGSASSSASRAAASSSARRSPIESAPGSCRCESPASCRRRRVRATYDLEYGSDSLEMHRDAIEKGQRVLIVDDLLATGGTARATVDLVKQIGGVVEGMAFLIELVALNGRAKLPGEKDPRRTEVFDDEPSLTREAGCPA